MRRKRKRVLKKHVSEVTAGAVKSATTNLLTMGLVAGALYLFDQAKKKTGV